MALGRAKQLRDGGFVLTCVWSASRIRPSPHIDHCFPWARLRNNDLWNLLPGRRATQACPRIACAIGPTFGFSVSASSSSNQRIRRTIHGISPTGSRSRSPTTTGIRRLL